MPFPGSPGGWGFLGMCAHSFTPQTVKGTSWGQVQVGGSTGSMPRSVRSALAGVMRGVRGRRGLIERRGPKESRRGGREGAHNRWEQLCVPKPVGVKPPAIYCLNT